MQCGTVRRQKAPHALGTYLVSLLLLLLFVHAVMRSCRVLFSECICCRPLPYHPIFLFPGVGFLFPGVGSCPLVSSPLHQARIVALNSKYFLKNGGHAVISIKANCIDSTVAAEAVFASEIKILQGFGFKPEEYVTLEPFERDHAVVVRTYVQTRNLFFFRILRILVL